MALELFRDRQFFKKKMFEYKYAHRILTPSDLVGLDEAYLDKFKAIEQDTCSSKVLSKEEIR